MTPTKDAKKQTQFKANFKVPNIHQSSANKKIVPVCLVIVESVYEYFCRYVQKSGDLIVSGFSRIKYDSRIVINGLCIQVFNRGNVGALLEESICSAIVE